MDAERPGLDPRVPLWLAGTAAALALGVVLGWTAHIPALLGEGLTPATTKFSTALAMLTGAVGLALRARSAEDAAVRHAGAIAVFGVAALLLGIAILVANGDGSGAFVDAARRAVTLAPGGSDFGLPSSLSGAVSVAFGIALVSEAVRGPRALTAAVAVAVLSVALLGVVGVVFHVSDSDSPYFTRLGAPTIAGFAALGAGLLALRPRYGMMSRLLEQTAAGHAFRRLIAASIAVPFVLGWIRVLSHQSGSVAVVPGIAIYSLSMMAALGVLSWVLSVQLSRLDGQRAAAEAALREAYEFQRAVTFGADLAIISTDDVGIIRLFNPGAERMLGYTAEELVGRATPERLHDANEVRVRADELTATLGRTIEPGFEVFVAPTRDGAADQREWTYIRKDGSRLRVLLSVTAQRDANGAIFGFLGIASDVSELRRTADALVASNREKEVLLREVHHRVKNNLQVVSSMLSLQSRYSADPAVVGMFEESRERVRAMALIHERLQGASGFGSVDFVGYARDLVALIHVASARTRPRVQVRVEGAAVNVPLDAATPLGLILNELIGNVLKHAFGPDDEGRCDVRVHPSTTGLRLTVTNGGRPLPPDLSFEGEGSLGLRLVRALVRQVDGVVQVQHEPEPAVVVEARWTAAAGEGSG